MAQRGGTAWRDVAAQRGVMWWHSVARCGGTVWRDDDAAQHADAASCDKESSTPFLRIACLSTHESATTAAQVCRLQQAQPRTPRGLTTPFMLFLKMRTPAHICARGHTHTTVRHLLQQQPCSQAAMHPFHAHHAFCLNTCPHACAPNHTHRCPSSPADSALCLARPPP